VREPDEPFHLGGDRVAERLERPLVEATALLEACDTESGLVDPCVSLPVP